MTIKSYAKQHKDEKIIAQNEMDYMIHFSTYFIVVAKTAGSKSRSIPDCKGKRR